MDLKKIYRFEFFSWIWKMFANFWLFCWFQKEFSIWNVFRFENDLFIQNIIVGMKNISRFEKDLSTWKSFVDLGNIYCEWSFSATINSNPLSYFKIWYFCTKLSWISTNFQILWNKRFINIVSIMNYSIKNM